MGYHEQYYGDDLRPDPTKKYTANGSLNRANFRFMNDTQFTQFMQDKVLLIPKIHIDDIFKVG